MFELLHHYVVAKTMLAENYIHPNEVRPDLLQVSSHLHRNIFLFVNANFYPGGLYWRRRKLGVRQSLYSAGSWNCPFYFSWTFFSRLPDLSQCYAPTWSEATTEEVCLCWCFQTMLRLILRPRLCKIASCLTDQSSHRPRPKCYFRIFWIC